VVKHCGLPQNHRLTYRSCWSTIYRMGTAVSTDCLLCNILDTCTRPLDSWDWHFCATVWNEASPINATQTLASTTLAVRECVESGSDNVTFRPAFTVLAVFVGLCEVSNFSDLLLLLWIC